MDTSPPVDQVTATDSPRPTAISVACILGCIGAFIALPVIFSDVAREVGAWYAPYLAVRTAVGLVCVGGLWNMRRWAFFTYAGFFVLNQVVTLAAHHWSIFALPIPAAVVIISLVYLPKMR